MCDNHDDNDVETMIDDHQPDPNTQTKTILVMPNRERMEGSGPEIKLFKWHCTSGHMNETFLHKVALNCDGMEELVHIPKKTCLPSCNACKRGKSRRRTPAKKKPSHSY
mmetsp:Transcript_62745/g.130439  ORF Transcript_62745/g.130439 Transcript_62745/m.130439 type:complete len:109 (-) Transcript_62745:3424-3750(-)